MPYGTCNGNYRCDSCGKALDQGSLAWVDLKPKRSKLYCMKCKPKESLLEKRPPTNKREKKELVLKVLLKILRRQNSELKKENARLKRNKHQRHCAV